MKYAFALAILLSSISHAMATTSFDSLPVTGSDVAEVLELNPSNYHISKTLITFGTPKHVVLRYSTFGQTHDTVIPGVSPSVTLMTYVPKDGGPVKPMRYWISGSGGAIASAFAFDSSKVKFTRSGLFDGTFKIIGSDTKDFSKPEYVIQIVTSDKSAEQGAAANP